MELAVARERALLIGVQSPHGNGKFDCDLDELERLADTAGAVVVGKVIQKTRQIHPTYFIGTGKAEEVAGIARERRVDVIISDSELTSAQVRNLEELTDTKVIDRTELILDIFARRAQTLQAKLQVELAQLEYLYPRLKNLWSHFSRFTGGVGARGPGEQQLEVDRRLVRKRLISLRKELATLAERREEQVGHRHGFFTVCLVGYTNAGKSTLMNALTGADVFVEDKLFATLDTRTRRWELPDARKALLSDTVGFIKKLPAHLVASFHATLEELRQADLLLHVIDLASGSAVAEARAVEAVLTEMKCSEKPILAVLNKMDILKDDSDLRILKLRYPDAVAISALKRQGLEALAEVASESLTRGWQEAELTLEATRGDLLSYVASEAQVIEAPMNLIGADDGKLRLRVKASEVFLRKLEKTGAVTVRVLSDKAPDGEPTPPK